MGGFVGLILFMMAVTLLPVVTAWIMLRKL
jgi:uncharacterized membrane protein